MLTQVSVVRSRMGSFFRYYLPTSHKKTRTKKSKSLYEIYIHVSIIKSALLGSSSTSLQKHYNRALRTYKWHTPSLTPPFLVPACSANPIWSNQKTKQRSNGAVPNPPTHQINCLTSRPPRYQSTTSPPTSNLQNSQQRQSDPTE